MFVLFFIPTTKIMQVTCQQHFPWKILYRFGSTVSVKSDNIFSTSRATHLCNLSNNTWKHFPWAKREIKKKSVTESKVICFTLNFFTQDVKLLIMGPRGQFSPSDLICLVKVAFKTFSIGKAHSGHTLCTLHVLHIFLHYSALHSPLFVFLASLGFGH